MPVLHVVAGPNGAGKSTFVARILQPVTFLPFVNADEIAAARWPEDPMRHAAEASQAAAEERAALLAARSSFITETVFSHESKVALISDASKAGYLVTLHVVMVPAALPIARVAHRVRFGGHDVPEEKVRARYARLWPLVAQAVECADAAVFYDNSLASQPFRRVATFRHGRAIEPPEWPAWTPLAIRALSG